MRACEAGEVCALVDRVFSEFVAGDFPPEGVRAFGAYNSPGPLSRRCDGDHFCLVAESDGRIAGMIEMRDHSHVSMLFVEERGRGLGRALLERALAVCRERNPGLETVSVHSSRFAVPFYGRFGFRTIGPERTKGGITFVPMALRLAGEGLPGGGIRRAEAADYPAVTALLEQLGYPSSSHQTIVRMALLASREDHALFVAEEEGRVTGFIHACTVLRLGSDPFAEIAGLAVDGERRRSGLGRRLVEAAERWAAALGCRTMRVRANVLREEAPGFYALLGYERSKEQTVFTKKL
jgi:GNAT superfamily N-acetyltransferase